jgi:hypothetical protein
VVSLTSSSGGYINGRNSANLELLIDKTSSIYLYVIALCNKTITTLELDQYEVSWSRVQLY